MLHPLATAAQGDEGNARVLAHRAALRGIATTVATVHDGAVPDAEHLPRRRASTTTGCRCSPSGCATVAWPSGSRTAPSCSPSTPATRCWAARYVTPDGTRHDGLGAARRALLARHPPVPRPGHHPRGAGPGPGRAERLREPPRHDRGRARAPSRSSRSSWATATTAPATGRGSGQVIGTYLHGPLLARNADLADLLLGWATGAPSTRPRRPPGRPARPAHRGGPRRPERVGWPGLRQGAPSVAAVPAPPQRLTRGQRTATRARRPARRAELGEADRRRDRVEHCSWCARKVSSRTRAARLPLGRQVHDDGSAVGVEHPALPHGEAQALEALEHARRAGRAQPELVGEPGRPGPPLRRAPSRRSGRPLSISPNLRNRGRRSCP